MRPRMIPVICTLLTLIPACNVQSTPTPIPKAGQLGQAKDKKRLPETKGDPKYSIEVSASEIMVAGKSVKIGQTTIADLEGILGERSREPTVIDAELYVWDDLGIRVFWSKDDNLVKAIDLSFDPKADPDYFPKVTFVGVFRIEGAPISKTTTHTDLGEAIETAVKVAPDFMHLFYVNYTHGDVQFFLDKQTKQTKFVKILRSKRD